ncbi:hypothetical protein Lpp14_06810 [Lacticaseibacillus paracasei subsp. paracasei Lpp14]|uniref:Uncharacterized protein n=1 Tax=Lacticaseibacillus paracasei subsp. paracasei Lpp14 TaxID=1256204 RepID=A0A829GRJ3_LACPA|nr:hypothetical protein Lpp14_06810 [Lacticaseibacillus paracasei subsp. paracasei Lpp14]
MMQPSLYTAIQSTLVVRPEVLEIVQQRTDIPGGMNNEGYFSIKTESHQELAHRNLRETRSRKD